MLREIWQSILISNQRDDEVLSTPFCHIKGHLKLHDLISDIEHCVLNLFKRLHVLFGRQHTASGCTTKINVVLVFVRL